MIKTLIFLSNYFNHHQKPISDFFFGQLGAGYLFIETEPMTEERKKMGWGMESYPDYVVSFGQYEKQKEQYSQLIMAADAVIVGSAPHELVKDRIIRDKLVFRYAERPLKKGFEPLKYPVRYWRWHKQNPCNKRVYLLCASAYTAVDYAKFGLFKKRCFKWGYFPATKWHEDIDALIQKKQPASILWAARMNRWKHPEIPVEVAHRLKKDGYTFTLRMIGEGTMRKELQKRIEDESLQDCVELLDFMKPEAVREYMEENAIFLFTSDRNEGWGAVLNESMNSGCAVVANRAIGAAPFLIRHEQNGLLYDDVDDLYKKVVYLLEHPENCRKLGNKAYDTITQEWCAENAANRFLHLATAIFEEKSYLGLFRDGVCSPAD